MPRIAPMYRRDKTDLVGWLFECPGCGFGHAFYTVQTNRPGEEHAVWSFNGDVDRPTFNPSLVVRWDEGPNHELRVCHSFVRDGQIQFLGDCTHHLAGQTVDLIETEGGG